MATISGGLAMITAPDTADTLIDRADEALYEAKAAGRNRTCLHDGSRTELAGGSSEKLADFIHRKDVEMESIESGTDAESTYVGVYLQREAISPQLAQTCDELRQFIEQRKCPLPSAEVAGRS
jgi:hypothetical protein